MDNEQRIKDLERRVAQLELDALPHKRLGPQPKDLVPNPEEVAKLVEAAEAAIRRDIPEVDRSKRCLTDGSPEPADQSYTEIDSRTGQQKGYVVLCPTERAKGFIRPVRQTYRHLACNTTTHMGLALAETYARDPEFYGGTFCCSCRAHFPLDQFVWEGTNERVGS